MKNKHLFIYFNKKGGIMIALTFGLLLSTSCGHENTSVVQTEIAVQESETENRKTEITDMTFANDDEFWSFAENEYETVSIDDIQSGNKKRTMVIIDGLLLNVSQENALTNEYLVGYKSSDGTYLCYKSDLMPDTCNLMTSMDTLDSLKQGDILHICAYILNSDYVNFDTIYGLKVIGTDMDEVKLALNISDNPLLNLQVQTDYVMNGYGDAVIGERAYVRIDKNDMINLSYDQYAEFAEKVVKDSGYNWYSIIFEDGTGIQFFGSNPGNATYGKMDFEGTVVESYGDIQIQNGQYSYIPAE